jgi:cold shock CspA family protein
MRVALYAPDRLYGFCEGDGERVFFHLEVFAVGRWSGIDEPPPPILGEEVRVEFDPETPRSSGRAPRAKRVERVAAPLPIEGVVDTFHPETGWGFAAGDDGVSYYLHRSEVLNGRLPLPGQRVRFYGGFKRGRPRACHVRVGRVST